MNMATVICALAYVAQEQARARRAERVKAELADPRNIPIYEMYGYLKCRDYGLTSKEVTKRLKIFGPNSLDGEKKKKKSLKLLGCITGKSGDVGPKCMVLRNYRWKELKAAELVPGDIIVIKAGDVVPADVRLLPGHSIKVEPTGESRAVRRGPAEDVLSGSRCTRGVTKAVVFATGIHTFFARKAAAAAAHLVDTKNNVGHFHMVLRKYRWKELKAAELVPGDIIVIKAGDIVPADVRLLPGHSIKVVEPTGESRAVRRGPSENVFSGSRCTRGATKAVVFATGIHTFFARQAASAHRPCRHHKQCRSFPLGVTAIAS